MITKSQKTANRFAASGDFLRQDLGEQGGAAAMVARSIEIRMRTYYRLAERTLTPAHRATP